MADNDQVDDIPDVSLIDNDIQAPTDDTPSSTAQETTDTVADTQDEQPKDKETPAGEQPPTEDKPQEQPAEDAAAEQRRLNAEAAARRVQERQRTKQAVAQQLDQTYGPKSADELVDEGLNQHDAQIEALRQTIAYNEQRASIAELNAGMQSEAVNVANDFPVFNQNSPEYDQEFANMVAQQYRQASRLEQDDNGIVINAEIPLYDYYQSMATIYSRGATKGQQQGQQEAQAMLSRTENPGGSSSTSGGDDLDALEERLGNVVIT